MKKIALIAALLAVPCMAHAETKEQGSGPNPYVECGIGAALFPTVSWAAVTSNAIWDLGTTAFSSASSSPEMCNGKKVATATLIIESLEGMEKDIANGGGTYTTALLDTMECQGDRQAIVTQMRNNYSAVASKEGYSTQSRQDRAAGVYSSAKSAVQAVAPSCAVSL